MSLFFSFESILLMMSFLNTKRSNKGTGSNSSKSSGSVTTLQVYLANEPMSPEWLDTKVRYNTSPTACLLLEDGEVTYHTKGNPPVSLDKNELDGLFKRIGKGWSRLAKPGELVIIMSVIEAYTTDTENSTPDSGSDTRLQRSISF